MKIEVPFSRKSLGAAIKFTRFKRGLSQGELAESLGVTRTAVTEMENGNRNVSIEELCRIAHFTGHPIPTILNRAKELNAETNSPTRK